MQSLEAEWLFQKAGWRGAGTGQFASRLLYLMPVSVSLLCPSWSLGASLGPPLRPCPLPYSRPPREPVG